MYVRLSLLMLLQWSVPAALSPLYSLRLQQLGFTPMQIGICSATQSVAGILSSLLAGQIADRWVSAEKAMATCALLAAACLWLIAQVHDFTSVFVLTLLFWAVTGPMLLLGTTISFANLSQPQRQFVPIRMWGTVGWMLVAWVVGYWMNGPMSLIAWIGQPSLDDVPRFGAIIALSVAVYTWTLPHTPPRPVSGSRWLAPLEALELVGKPAFAAYLFCVFSASMTFPFVTQNAPLLLRELGVEQANIAQTLSVAQVTEVILLGLLPVMQRLLGLRGTMLAGLAAWLAAMSVLAVGGPCWLVIASLGLHGLYVTGFLVAGQVYANSLAEGDMRASVQGLFNVVNALGMLIGNLMAGWLSQSLAGGLPATFTVAAFIVGSCGVVFLLAFRQPSTG